VSPVGRAARQTFKALRVRNYRLYFVGQVISASGTWMHAVALGLLVLSDRLHGSGFNVGIVTALQFLPMLLFGSWGGVIVDRVDKRRLLYVTQAASGVLALALGLLTAVGSITMGEVYLIATLFGMVNLFDNPARQTFVSEMVGHDLMPNAISLNSVVMNSARVIGPAIGGVLIFAVGLAACFLFNAASYVAVIVALFMMRPTELHRRPVVVRAKGQVREGLRYVWSTPGLRDPLLAMAVVGIFAFNFTTTLPLLATHTFGGGAGTYSALMAAMGLGAVIGGLMVAHRSRPSTAMLSLIGLAFGVMLLAVAAAPTEAVALVALVFMGICSISFISTANATIQLQADPAMRGRVMALFSIAFLGSTPIGAPLVGWIADISNPRVAVLVGGVATLLACAPLALRYCRHGGTARSTLEVAAEVPDAEPGEVVDFSPRPIVDVSAAGGVDVSADGGAAGGAAGEGPPARRATGS
jgi:MFS family permease